MWLYFKQSELWEEFLQLQRCKTSFHVLNFPFKGQKPTMTALGADGTPSFTRKTSRDYKAEKTFLLRNHLRQSQLTAT